MAKLEQWRYNNEKQGRYPAKGGRPCFNSASLYLRPLQVPSDSAINFPVTIK